MGRVVNVKWMEGVCDALNTFLPPGTTALGIVGVFQEIMHWVGARKSTVRERIGRTMRDSCPAQIHGEKKD